MCFERVKYVEIPSHLFNYSTNKTTIRALPLSKITALFNTVRKQKRSSPRYLHPIKRIYSVNLEFLIKAPPPICIQLTKYRRQQSCFISNVNSSQRD